MISSIRNFFLSFIISLAICGISAYFIVGFINNTMTGIFQDPDVEETEPTTESPLQSDTPRNDIQSDGKPDTMTVLLCGLDDGQSQMNEAKETDSIILLQIDRVKEQFTISSLPCDMKIDTNGYTLRLGMVYSEFSIQHLINCVRAVTGLSVDYYAVIDYEGLVKFFETIGKIDFNVPLDMYYMPEWKQMLIDREIEKLAKDPNFGPLMTEEEKEPEIDIKQGQASLEGEEILQILRYKGYSNGDIGRIAVAKDIMKEVLRQKVTVENFSKAPDIFSSLKSAVTTNMTELDFVKNIDLIFSFSKFTFTDLTYPGETRLENGNMFFFPSIPDAMNLFNPYRRVK